MEWVIAIDPSHFLLGDLHSLYVTVLILPPNWGRPLLLCVYQKLQDKCQVLDAQCDGTWVVHMNWAYLYFDAPLFFLHGYYLYTRYANSTKFRSCSSRVWQKAKKSTEYNPTDRLKQATTLPSKISPSHKKKKVFLLQPMCALNLRRYNRWARHWMEWRAMNRVRDIWRLQVCNFTAGRFCCCARNAYVFETDCDVWDWDKDEYLFHRTWILPFDDFAWQLLDVFGAS